MKTFADTSITVTDALGTFRSVITGDALGVLWSKNNGSQDADELIEANRLVLEQVSSWKREADEGEFDGSVRVTGADLDG